MPNSVFQSVRGLSREQFVASAQDALSRDRLDLAHSHALVGLSCYLYPAQPLDAPGPGIKIGVSRRGGAAQADTRRRSTALSDWLTTLHSPGVLLTNLQ